MASCRPAWGQGRTLLQTGACVSEGSGMDTARVPVDKGEPMTLAYLDPGSGSMIISAVVGGAAAAGVVVKQARSRGPGAFGRKPKPAEAVATEATNVTAEPEAVPADDHPVEVAASGDDA